MLTTAELAISTPAPTPDVCANCPDQPCVSHCPADAVSTTRAFSVASCFNYRSSEDSRCQDRCLARLACPVAQTQQYPFAMTQYLYTKAMETVRRYVGR